MRKIAIITTRQNYSWTSMQEVIPAIEKCWEESAESSRIINVDVDPLRDHLDFIMSCEALIVIAFNETISRFIVTLRSQLNLQIPIVLHLYGHATIACWPEHRFGALDCFNAGDAFIGTCGGDLLCMEKTFINAKSYNIPYPYYPDSETKPNTKGERVFAYVGRISDQKNLHLLVLAYSELLKKKVDSPPLLIYGKEDFLGSPNTGISSHQCLDDLTKLIKHLGIENQVFFKGFQSRDEIYKTLGSEHIFVSASTHSDENFGMAAMRSLASGGRLVLSHWGGHQIFKEQHPKRVWTSPVTFYHSKPVIDPIDFAGCLHQALISDNAPGDPLLSSYFSPDEIVTQFKKVLAQLSFSDEKLHSSQIAKQAFEQQAKFEAEGNIQKVFDGYEDELAQIYLSCYC